VVRIVLNEEPVTLDIFGVSNSNYDTINKQNMTDTLSWIDRDTRELVALSGFTGWEQMEPNRWRYYLREGVQFHNGEEWDAEAAAFSLNIQGQPTGGTSYNLTGPYSAEVVDPLTVDVVCPEDCPIFPQTATFAGFQAPQWYTEQPESVTTRNTMGFGPYQLVNWDHGVSIRLESYPDYVPVPELVEGQLPAIDNVIYYWRSETAVQAAMVATGEADLAFNISIDDRDAVPRFQSTASGQALMMAVDTVWNPVLSDVRVRRALAYGWDCQEVVETILQGTTDCRGNAAYPGVTGITDENIAPYQYDPVLSQQLLEEAGYSGERIRLITRPSGWPGQLEVMEAITNYWRLIDVNVDLQVLESSVRNQIRDCGMGDVDGDPTRQPPCDPGDIYEFGRTLDAMDFGYVINTDLSCHANRSRVCDPRIEELMPAAMQATGEERHQRMKEIADLVHEDVLLMPLFDRPLFIGQNPDLVWDVRFDRRMRVNEMYWAQ
jgi:peptide/nickel transport system substrate-binding protein